MKGLIEKVNYFTFSFLGIIGLTVLPEVFQENDLPDKIDDALLFILGLVGIWWYRKHSTHGKANVSVIFLAIGLFIKIIGIIIEHADKEALGDDLGVGTALLLALILVAWQIYHSRTKS